MAAAAILMVEPANARLAPRLYKSSQQNQNEIEEIIRSRGGFPQIDSIRQQDEAEAKPGKQDEKSDQFRLQAPVRKSSQVQGANAGKAQPGPLSGQPGEPSRAPSVPAQPSPAERKEARQEAQDKRFSKGASQQQESKPQSPPEQPQKQADSKEPAPSPAPVPTPTPSFTPTPPPAPTPAPAPSAVPAVDSSKEESKAETTPTSSPEEPSPTIPPPLQEQTPTSPPSSTQETPSSTDSGPSSSQGASEPAAAQSRGFGGLFESLKERFQPEAAKPPSTEGLSETEGAKGEASPPPALTAGIEADTDKKSDTPAVQSLMEEGKEAAAEAIPDKVASQVEEAGKLTEESSKAAEASSGGFGGFFESLKERFQPETTQQPSKENLSSTEGAKGEASPPPALTAAIEADTDKKSDTPAVQSLVEEGKEAAAEAIPDTVASQVEEASKLTEEPSKAVEAPTGGLGGFFESLKERFQPDAAQQPSTESLSSTIGAKGEASSPPALRAAVEAGTDKKSDTPAIQGLLDDVKEAAAEAIPDKVATQVEEAGKLTQEAAKTDEPPASGLGGFFESLRERFQPEAAQQPSTEDPSSTEGAKGEASPPPALTAAIEADTDKKSDTPAVQSLVEEGKEAAAEAIPDKVASQVEEAGKLTQDAAQSASAPESSSGGFFESLRELFQPEAAKQPSTEGLSETGGAEREVSSPPALTTATTPTEAASENGPGGFLESVKETFQPEPAQQPSSDGLSETGGDMGEASSLSPLTTGNQNDTDNKSDTPAVQSLIAEGKEAAAGALPDNVATQVQEAGKFIEGAAQTEQVASSGLGGFFESLRERFQPQASQQPNMEGLSSTEGAKGEASPPPALIAEIEADTDKKSGTPAVQSLINEEAGAVSDVAPEKVANQVEEAGQQAQEAAEDEQPQGFFESGGALKSLNEKFPPEPEEQPSTEGPSKTEDTSEGLPPQAPTADSEADTAEQSVTPAVQSLREEGTDTAKEADTQQVTSQVEEASKLTEGSSQSAESPPNAVGGFLEGLKDRFQPESNQPASTEGLSETGMAKGEASSPPALTADIQADTGKQSDNPVVQAVTQAANSAAEAVKPEPAANQTEDNNNLFAQGSPSEDTFQTQSVGLFDKVKEAFTPEPAVRQAESLAPPLPAQTAPEQADAAEATPNPVKEPYPLDPAAPVAESAQEIQRSEQTPVLDLQGGHSGLSQPQQVNQIDSSPPALTADLQDGQSSSPNSIPVAEPQGSQGGPGGLQEVTQPSSTEETAKQLSEGAASQMQRSNGLAQDLVAEAPSDGPAGLFDKVKEAFTPEPAVRQAETPTPPRPAQTAPEQADAAEATPNPVDEPYSLDPIAPVAESAEKSKRQTPVADPPAEQGGQDGVPQPQQVKQDGSSPQTMTADLKGDQSSKLEPTPVADPIDSQGDAEGAASLQAPKTEGAGSATAEQVASQTQQAGDIAQDLVAEAGGSGSPGFFDKVKEAFTPEPAVRLKDLPTPPTPAQTAPEQADAAEATPNPVDEPYSLDPAAPVAEESQGAQTATQSPVSAPQGSGKTPLVTPSSPQGGAGPAASALTADMQADKQKTPATPAAQSLQGLLAEAPSNKSGGFFDKVKEAFTPEPAVKQAESPTPPRPAQTAPEQADAAEATPNPVDEPYSLDPAAPVAEDAQGAATATVSPVSIPQGTGGTAQVTPRSPQHEAGPASAPTALTADRQADNDKLSDIPAAQNFQGLVAEAPSGFFDKVKEAFTPEPAVRQNNLPTPPLPAQAAPQQADAAEATPNPVDEPYPLDPAAPVADEAQQGKGVGQTPITLPLGKEGFTDYVDQDWQGLQGTPLASTLDPLGSQGYVFQAAEASYAFPDFETAEAAAADSDRDPVRLFQRFLGSLKPQPSQQASETSVKEQAREAAPVADPQGVSEGSSSGDLQEQGLYPPALSSYNEAATESRSDTPAVKGLSEGESVKPEAFAEQLEQAGNLGRGMSPSDPPPGGFFNFSDIAKEEEEFRASGGKTEDLIIESEEPALEVDPGDVLLVIPQEAIPEDLKAQDKELADLQPGDAVVLELDQKDLEEAASEAAQGGDDSSSNKADDAIVLEVIPEAGSEAAKGTADSSSADEIEGFIIIAAPEAAAEAGPSANESASASKADQPQQPESSSLKATSASSAEALSAADDSTSAAAPDESPELASGSLKAATDSASIQAFQDSRTESAQPADDLPLASMPEKAKTPNSFKNVSNSVSELSEDTVTEANAADQVRDSVRSFVEMLRQNASNSLKSLGDSASQAPQDSFTAANEAVQSAQASATSTLDKLGQSAANSLKYTSSFVPQLESQDSPVQNVNRPAPPSPPRSIAILKQAKVTAAPSAYLDKRVDAFNSFVDSLKQKFTPDESLLGSDDSAPGSVSQESSPQQKAAAIAGAAGQAADDTVKRITGAMPDTSDTPTPAFGEAKEKLREATDSAKEKLQPAEKQQSAPSAPSSKPAGDSKPPAEQQQSAQSTGSPKPAGDSKPAAEKQASTGGSKAAAESKQPAAGEGKQSAEKQPSTASPKAAADNKPAAPKQPAEKQPGERQQSAPSSSQPKPAAASKQSEGGDAGTAAKDKTDPEGRQAKALAGKAADSVGKRLPQSMGGKDKLENPAPDSLPGKFEKAVDNATSKTLPSQKKEPSAQSTSDASKPKPKPSQSSDQPQSITSSGAARSSSGSLDSGGGMQNANSIAADTANDAANAASSGLGAATNIFDQGADLLTKAIGSLDAFTKTIGAVTDAISGFTEAAVSAGDITEGISRAADATSELAGAVPKPEDVSAVLESSNQGGPSVGDKVKAGVSALANEVLQVTEVSGRDAREDADNPANTGQAPLKAAPTASDNSNKGDQVTSVADPENVDQALDSVGDAVENAVPDPKGAPSGLAPTSPVSTNSVQPSGSRSTYSLDSPGPASTNRVDQEGSIREALSAELADVANGAQRKVQQQQPQLNPTEGVAAARDAMAAIFAALMPVQAADAATMPGIESAAVWSPNSIGALAADVTAPAKEAAAEAATAAGPDTSKGLLISVGVVAALAVVTFSLSGKPPVAKQAADAASKVKDLNEFGE